MTAVVDADSGKAAESKVRDVVGDDREIGPAEPMG
jgi:hypothetical protein